MERKSCGYWFFLAGVAAIFAFLLLPPVIAVWASFFANKILSFPPSGYTLTWYRSAWDDSSFSSGFVLSLQLGVCATIGSLALGVPASLAIERFEFTGRETIRQVLLAPFYVPAIVAGSAIYIYYVGVESLIGLQFVGTFPGLAIAHTLVALPWTIRLVCASLATASILPEEAARSLGANAIQTFTRVTIPSIRPGIVAAAMFSLIASFSDLEKSLFLVGPGKVTLPIAVVNYLEWNLDSTIAAVATVQMLVVGTALFVSNHYVKLGKVF
jgi:putative spermidine/putrescine transport system permease protein